MSDAGDQDPDYHKEPDELRKKISEHNYSTGLQGTIHH